MRAARIHRFGPPEVIVIDDVPRPPPASGEVLVRVASAGVGPWDAWIRGQRSVVHVDLPITLGSDLSGIVESVGPEVSQFAPGDEVWGVTNPNFVGAYAEFAVAKATMIAQKPKSLSFPQAASAPVVAVTAWQMLFDYAHAKAGQSILIHGGAGNVGAFAIQLAIQAGLQVITTAAPEEEAFVRNLGDVTVIDYKNQRFEEVAPKVDIVLDTVGGETAVRSLDVVKPGGVLVSAVSPPSTTRGDIRTVFFLVDVTASRLDTIGELFNQGKLAPRVGTILPLESARTAHQMLAGEPHLPGKIVLGIYEP
jgi:NADPH:quinone reductase-like Zn-dependent oxidoreductase